MTLRPDTPRAVLVTVGDELLLGETVDSNAAWLGRELESLGIRVVKRYTVGDVEDHIHQAVRRGLEDADLVLLTGGLGPTGDDLTREALAEFFDTPLRIDDELLRRLTRVFRESGYDELPSTNRKVAMVPEGAHTLPNSQGTAPGLLLETEEGELVVALPGVPEEMKAIARGPLRDVLTERLSDRLSPVHHRTIHTTGIAESELARRAEEVLPDDTGPVSVAFLPDIRGVDLRLTARDVEEEEARKWLDRVEEALEPVVEPYLFEAESGDLVEAVSEALRDRGILVATAESCTGGLVAKRITDRAGSSEVFRGGIVAYSNDVKMDVLGVPEEVLESEGAVSEEVARHMAEGVCRALDCEAGVGITGVAGPGGGTEEKPVGLVWYAVALGECVEAEHQNFPGDREQVRERSGQAALALLLRVLQDEAADSP